MVVEAQRQLLDVAEQLLAQVVEHALTGLVDQPHTKGAGRPVAQAEEQKDHGCTVDGGHVFVQDAQVNGHPQQVGLDQVGDHAKAHQDSHGQHRPAIGSDVSQHAQEVGHVEGLFGFLFQFFLKIFPAHDGSLPFVGPHPPNPLLPTLGEGGIRAPLPQRLP